MNLERSKWPFGVASVKRDGILYGLGYTEEELKRPYIAVVNSWNEYNPGHIHLREIAERVKQGIRDAGGLPFEVRLDGPNKETIAAMLEAEKIAHDPSVPHYSDVEEALRELKK